MLYLFLAHGFEETEAIAPLDLIRRAEMEIRTVGVGGILVTGAHGITVKADLAEEELPLQPEDGFQGIILPGGMPGTLNLEKSPVVQRYMDFAHRENKLIAAICAAPTIPGHKGYLNGVRACCFPGFEEQLSGAILTDGPICRDGNFITAPGAGAALDFGLAIVSYFHGEDRAKLLAAAIQMPGV